MPTETPKAKLCPFLPPMPVRTALSTQPTLSFMSCQGSACEVYDETAKACGMKTHVNIDMGKREIIVGDKK